jgi:hypothetical protein
VACLAYSHDFALLALAAHPALVIGHPNRAARRGFVLSICIPTLVVLVPLLVFVPPDWASTAFVWITAATPGRVAETIMLVMGGGVMAACSTALLAWALFSRSARARAGELMESVPRGYAFLGVWLVAPTIGLYLLSQYQSVLEPRYALASVPAFCLALATAIALLRPRVAVAVAVLAAAWLLGQTVEEGVLIEKQDWPGVASYVASSAAPGEPVVLFGASLIAANALLYYEPRFGVDRDELVWGEEVFGRLPPEFVLVSTRNEDGSGLQEALREGKRVWIVLSGYVSPEAESSLARVRASCEDQLERSFRHVTVLRLDRCAVRS